jgi:hypothetical protein
MVIGAIAGAAIILALRAIIPHPREIDLWAALIMVSALGILLWSKAGAVALILKQWGVT